MQIFKESAAAERFKTLLGSVRRRGIPELLNWLKATDFFEAPASTRYHGAEKAGLLKHSLAVYDNLVRICDAMDASGTEILPETRKIAGLLHDVCKVNFYSRALKWTKENGVWQQIGYYVVDDRYPVGHGEKSVVTLQKFINLTEEEVLAIRWHMGGFDAAAKDYTGMQALSAALDKCPLAVYLHAADLIASHVVKE